MSAEKPELQDFGITPEEHDLYAEKATHGLGQGLGCSLGLAATILVVSLLAFVFEEAGLAILAIFPGFLVASWMMSVVESAIVRFKRERLLKSPFASQIRLYEEALAAYNREQWEAEWEERKRLEAERAREREQLEAEQRRRRKLIEHWMSLSGPEFERELGTVYRNLGYRVETTAGSGDGGVDLILRKNGKTTVVQCKSHQAPIGPAIARDLFGAMVASRADSAILACTGGFTRGVLEFVQGKPITLISASELAILGEAVEDKPQDEANTPPICPKRGCGKEMVLRTEQYGRFWGCPRFPRCRGYRPV